MSNAMRRAYAMALAMASMGSSMGFGPESIEQAREVIRKTPRIKLSGVNHIGSIPKGCQLQRAEVIARKDDYHISIIIEIVAGTNKSFNQKLVAKQKEISTYISFTPISDLLLDNRFVLTQMPQSDEQKVVV
jgi:hypothetical protein